MKKYYIILIANPHIVLQYVSEWSFVLNSDLERGWTSLTFGEAEAVLEIVKKLVAKNKWKMNFGIVYAEIVNDNLKF